MEPEVLTAAVTEITKAAKQQEGAWYYVVRSARKYAMMKQTGRYVENDAVHAVHFSDQERMTKYMLDELLRDIDFAFLNDTLVGIAVSENT